MIKRFSEYNLIKENKMWYKTVPQMLNFLNDKSKKTWIWLDTETTGLGGPKKTQLTQVSAIATKYDFNNTTFDELGEYDQKISLTDETKQKYNEPDDKTKWVLSFNRYGSGKYKYRNEEEVVNEFFEWVSQFKNPLLIAQNASFDMAMLGGRHGHKITDEVFDTKRLIQLYYLPLLKSLGETDEHYANIVNEIGTSDRDNGLISSSMSKVGPALGIDMSGYHDALTDCRITINMYEAIVNFMKEHKDVDIQKYQTERIKIIRNS